MIIDCIHLRRKTGHVSDRRWSSVTSCGVCRHPGEIAIQQAESAFPALPPQRLPPCRVSAEKISRTGRLTALLTQITIMGLCEIRPNQLYVIYNLGLRGGPDNQVMGRTVDVSVPRVRFEQ